MSRRVERHASWMAGDRHAVTATRHKVAVVNKPAMSHVHFEGGASGKNLRADLVSEVRSLISERVPSPDSVEIVITANFLQSVRGHLPPDLSQLYNTVRGTGTVAAKTFQSPSGRVVIVMNDWLFSPNVDDADGQARLTRHAAIHESGHAAILQRGESSEVRRSERIGVSRADRIFTDHAEVVVDEYRCELLATSSGPPYPGDHAEHLDLAHLHDALLHAVALQYPGESMDRPYNEVRQAASVHWTELAYLAASLNGGTPPSSLARQTLWKRYVGADVYTGLTLALSGLLDAATAMPWEALDDAALKVSQALEASLQQLGFAILDQPDDGLYFDVLNRD